MNVSIINIGDELLIGQVVNSNASVMSRLLTEAGMDVNEVAVVSDREDAIALTLRRLLGSSDAVLITGGLGPTKDDVTKKALCDFFNSRLVENKEALDNVKRLFSARGYSLTPVNRAQALVPECCEVLNNDLGTAPCMWFTVSPDSQLATVTCGCELPTANSQQPAAKVVVSMPGVPFEMEWLMRNRVVPKLWRLLVAGLY